VIRMDINNITNVTYRYVTNKTTDALVWLYNALGTPTYQVLGLKEPLWDPNIMGLHYIPIGLVIGIILFIIVLNDYQKIRRKVKKVWVKLNY
jgi:DMSO/TMAO reductase YedYZ heme-binding membrane subunit